MAANDETFRILLTPSAKGALLAALGDHAQGSAIRLFVLPGARPRPNMAVERPRPHEEPITVDGVLMVIDETSRKYLAYSTVDYLEKDGHAGFHIEGPNLPSTSPNAPAVPAEPPDTPADRAPSAPANPAPTRGELERSLKNAFKKIFDPEVPMNIWDLGLIYGMEWPQEGKVHVRMTMTSPGCPVGEMLRDQVLSSALSTPGVKEAEVEIVWEPPWGPEKMSDFAKRQFGLL